jgi:hypothetical protein
MTDGTAHKVGMSNNVEKRRKELQTGNPRKILIEWIIELKDRNSSADLEYQLKHWASTVGKETDGGTEWYVISPKALAEMKQQISGIPPGPITKLKRWLNPLNWIGFIVYQFGRFIRTGLRI